MVNGKLKVNNSSGYRGITWDKINNKWRAEITKNYKCYKLGRFSCIKKAAKAYDIMAKKLFGDYARLNFPKGGDSHPIL